MSYYLAVDIGASSGRHIVGRQEHGEIQTKEVYRFPNGVTSLRGRLTWDIEALLNKGSFISSLGFRAFLGQISLILIF